MVASTKKLGRPKDPNAKTKRRPTGAKQKRDVSDDVREVIVPRCADRKRRERLERDDEAWLMYYCGVGSGLERFDNGTRENVFWYDFTEQQREMIRVIRNAILYGGDQALAATRGEGKTTIFRRMLMKYTLQGEINCSVLFCATGPLADKSLASIKWDLQHGGRLLDDYPEVCKPIRRLENTPNRAHYMTATGEQQVDLRKKFTQHPCKFSWGVNEMSLPDIPGSPAAGGMFITRGLEAEVRGLNSIGVRPKVAGIDDADTEETENSEDQAIKLEHRIDRAIAGLGSQQASIARVMLCTVRNRRCVAYKFTCPKQKPSWKGKRFAFLQHPPDRRDMWDRYMDLLTKCFQEGDEFGRAAHQLYLDNLEEMNRGAIVSNPHRFNGKKLPDGTQREVSALQHYFNQIHKTDEDSVKAEYDNDPPEDEEVERTILTAYHIQHNCRSGLDQGVVPEGTVAITAGLDIKKTGFHYVVIALNEEATGCVLEYNFFDINAGELRANSQATERAILYGLHEWRENRDAEPYIDLEGNERLIDLALIDEGWKEEAWANQPARQFCAEAGLSRFLPCKGASGSQYHEPKVGRRTIRGENCHVSFICKIPIVHWNADHYKQSTHDGFLTEPGEPGSLSLFKPPATKIGPRMQPHLGYAKHITAESWERRFVPGFRGWTEGFFKVGSQNHYLDATAQALVARSLMGVSVLPTPGGTPVASQRDPQEQRMVSGGYERERSW